MQIYIYTISPLEMHAYLTIMPNYRYGMLRNVTRYPLLSLSTSICLKNLLLLILEVMVISTWPANLFKRLVSLRKHEARFFCFGEFVEHRS